MLVTGWTSDESMGMCTGFCPPKGELFVVFLRDWVGRAGNALKVVLHPSELSFRSMADFSGSEYK